MTKIFIPSTYSIGEIKEIVDKIESKGFDTKKITVADSFDDFTHTLQPDDVVVLYSLDCFVSMIDLLEQTKSIKLISICQEWFAQPIENTQTYLTNLYELATTIHRTRTQRGLNRAVNKGKKLGRAKGHLGKLKITEQEVARVNMARRDQGLSLAAACGLVGCSINSYYSFNKRQEQGG